MHGRLWSYMPTIDCAYLGDKFVHITPCFHLVCARCDRMIDVGYINIGINFMDTNEERVISIRNAVESELEKLKMKECKYVSNDVKELCEVMDYDECGMKSWMIEWMKFIDNIFMSYGMRYDTENKWNESHNDICYTYVGQ